MTFKEYFLDHKLAMLINIIVYGLLLIIFGKLPLSSSDIVMIMILLLGSNVGIYFYYFLRKAKYLNQINQYIQNLDEKYLLSTLLQVNNTNEEERLYEIFRQMTASYNGEINCLQQKQADYYDYIQMWMHEIKLPISALQLMAENQHLNKYDVEVEIVRLERLLEQSLFYAKSEVVAHDYQIKPCSINEVLQKCLTYNAKELIHYNFQIKLPQNDAIVNTDTEWLRFIINQIIANAIKYRRETKLEFVLEEISNGYTLHIKDFGIGIPAKDLPQIFKKGYVGTNGRKIGQATGFGLYICQQLCRKLLIDLQVTSQLNQFTDVQLIFRNEKTTLIK